MKTKILIALTYLVMVGSWATILCAGEVDEDMMPPHDVVHSDAEKIPNASPKEPEEIPVEDDDVEEERPSRCLYPAHPELVEGQDDRSMASHCNLLTGPVRPSRRDFIAAQDERSTDVVNFMTADQKKKPLKS